MFGFPYNILPGFNGFGSAGAAYATILASFIGMSIMAFVFFSQKNRTDFLTLKVYKFNIDIFKKLFLFGNPAGIEFFCNITAFNLYVVLFGQYGIAAQSAVNITFSWNMIAFLPLLGIGSAATALTARNLGASNIRGAVKAIKSAMKIGFGFMSILVIFYGLYPAALIQVFKTPDADEFLKVSSLAVVMLRLTVIYLITDVLLVIYSGALRGAGDTKFIMFASIASHWFFLALPSALAVYFFKSSVITVWIIFIVFSIILAILYIYRFYCGNWKKIKMI